MNEPRKIEEQHDGETPAVAKRERRGSSEFRALMAEVSRLNDGFSASQKLNADIGVALDRQNQAILSIAASLGEIRETVTSIKAGNLSEAPSDSITEEQTTEVSVGPDTSEWDRIRDAFLAESSVSEKAEQAESQNAEVPDAVENAKVDEPCEAEEEPEDLEAFLESLPGAMHIPKTNDAAELKRVVVDRDRTIATLVQRLQKRTRQQQSISADQLADLVENCPEELAERVETSLKVLDQQVRLGELELSIERARVSRQLSRLEETREQLEANARALGLSINEDGTINGEAELRRTAGSKGRRWLGVLGFSH